MAFTKATLLDNKSALLTGGIHLLFILLFILIRFQPFTSQLPFEDGSIEVNLGSDADGWGDDQPEVMGDPAAVLTPSASRSTTSQQQLNYDEGFDEDAPVIKRSEVSKKADKQSTATPKNNTKNTTTTPSNKQITQQTAVKPKYTYPGHTGTGGNGATRDNAGTSEGNTQGAGDRGVPYGTPGASTYEGVPGSGGVSMSHTLRLRQIKSVPSQVAEFNQGGKVTVSVTVNPEGKIINKKVKSAPNARLRSLALSKVDSVTFYPNKDASPEEFGEIIFIFKTR